MKKNKLTEYKVACGLAIIHFALWYYFAYVKYKNVAVKDYNYILGLPEWFFYSAVATSIFIIVLVIVFVNLLLNDEIKEEESSENR